MASRHAKKAIPNVCASKAITRAKEILRKVDARSKKLKRNRGIIVAEGDSWFNYVWLSDVLHQLEDLGYDVEHVAHWGDTAEDMAYNDDQMAGLAKKLRKVEKEYGGKAPKAVLLSAGGNDMAGDEFSALLNHKNSGLPTFSKEALDILIGSRLECSIVSLVSSTTYLCEAIFKKRIPILLHGYDYPVPDGRGFGGVGWFAGPWLRPGFRKKGYSDLQNTTNLMKVPIDRLNKVVSRVAARASHVKYVRLTGTLSTNLKKLAYKKWWANELHPKKRGFKKIAAKFDAVLAKLP